LIKPTGRWAIKSPIYFAPWAGRYLTPF